MSCLGPDVVLPALRTTAGWTGPGWVVADRHTGSCDGQPCTCQRPNPDALVDDTGVRFYLHPAEPAELGAFMVAVTR